MTQHRLFTTAILCLFLLIPLNVGADRSGLKTVVLIDGGEKSVVNTDAETVGEYLRRLEHPETIARVFPDRGSNLMNGGHLFIYRRGSTESSETQTIPASTTNVRSWALPSGRSLEIRGSRPGRRTGSSVKRKPVNRMVLHGQADYKNRRLAELRELGSLTLVATGYSPHRLDTAPYDDGFSAIGLPAGYGIVAVDPRVIPLGTRLYVEGYGYAIAADVGGDIEGHRIDLCFPKRQDALLFGRRDVTVHILD
jgi:3D (Asp-Asp-Asp) domain-containing protein